MYGLECRKLANILGRIVELMARILYVNYNREALSNKLPSQFCVASIV